MFGSGSMSVSVSVHVCVAVYLLLIPVCLIQWLLAAVIFETRLTHIITMHVLTAVAIRICLRLEHRTMLSNTYEKRKQEPFLFETKNGLRPPTKPDRPTTVAKQYGRRARNFDANGNNTETLLERNCLFDGERINESRAR